MFPDASGTSNLTLSSLVIYDPTSKSIANNTSKQLIKSFINTGQGISGK